MTETTKCMVCGDEILTSEYNTHLRGCVDAYYDNLNIAKSMVGKYFKLVKPDEYNTAFMIIDVQTSKYNIKFIALRFYYCDVQPEPYCTIEKYNYFDFIGHTKQIEQSEWIKTTFSEHDYNTIKE